MKIVVNLGQTKMFKKLLSDFSMLPLLRAGLLYRYFAHQTLRLWPISVHIQKEMIPVCMLLANV
jgi:hypothetical protein